jgi:hypothetical protein
VDYTRPFIEKQDSGSSKGRGIFTNQSQLIMVCRVYAMISPCDDPNNANMIVHVSNDDFWDVGEKTKLLPVVVQTLVRHPKTGKDLYSLNAGNEFLTPVPEEHVSSVDVARIQKIIINNWFGIEQEDNFKMANAYCHNEELEGMNGCGLWIQPSWFNHSCFNNCFYIIVGDFMLVVSNREIPLNTELTIAYVDVENDYQKQQEAFFDWNGGEGFE